MKKNLFIDPEKCTGCRLCELACSLEKKGEFNLMKSMISLMKVSKLGINVPITCQQCGEPACEHVCPTRALSRDEETSAMVINPDLCIACQMCTIVCPFGGVSIDTEEGIAVKCDLCDGDPTCVKYCAYETLKFAKVNEKIRAKRREAVDKLSKLLEIIA